jgi:hypothetical protein
MHYDIKIISPDDGIICQNISIFVLLKLLNPRNPFCLTELKYWIGKEFPRLIYPCKYIKQCGGNVILQGCRAEGIVYNALEQYVDMRRGLIFRGRYPSRLESAEYKYT